MIAQTSLWAYLKIRDSGRLNENETIIKDVYSQYPEGKTIHEIAEILNWTDNRVSGRTSDMKKKGWLVAVPDLDNKPLRKINRTTGHSAEILTLACNINEAVRYWHFDIMQKEMEGKEHGEVGSW